MHRLCKAKIPSTFASAAVFWCYWTLARSDGPVKLPKLIFLCSNGYQIYSVQSKL